MTNRHLATFVFEHETVLGDLFQIISEQKAKVEEIIYARPYPDEWKLVLSFPTKTNLREFAFELGRDPIQ